VSTTEHGFLTVAIAADKARATFTLIPASHVTVDYSQKSGDLQSHVRTVSFDVVGGQLTPVA